MEKHISPLNSLPEKVRSGVGGVKQEKESQIFTGMHSWRCDELSRLESRLRHLRTFLLIGLQDKRTHIKGGKVIGIPSGL